MESITSFEEDRVWIMDPRILEDSARDSFDTPPTLHHSQQPNSSRFSTASTLAASGTLTSRTEQSLLSSDANHSSGPNSHRSDGPMERPRSMIGLIPAETSKDSETETVVTIGEAADSVTDLGGGGGGNNGIPPSMRPHMKKTTRQVLAANAYASREPEVSQMEKQYLLACERGDLASVKHYLKLAAETRTALNVNCVDPLGRSALLIAIENENVEMIEVLLEASIETGDALLYAINEENVEAVELILYYLEKTDKFNTENQGVEISAQSGFTPDITPIILAAHRDNYEIIKLLLDRGASIPHPHDVRCICKECLQFVAEDSLRLSRSRINAYRALASPSLICLSTRDPILYSFELSWELRRLSSIENEFKIEYQDLSQKCQKFAVDMLDQTRGSKELEIILNHDNSDRMPFREQEAGERMQLTRLKLAIQFRQKRFVAHPNCQQLLASMWYEGLPGFRRRNILFKILLILGVSLAFPFLALCYLFAPKSTIGQFMRKPFIKFLCHSASYCTFLILLILASQRINYDDLFNFAPKFGPGINRSIEEDADRKERRGPPPSPIEWAICAFVAGLVWTEIKQLWDVGLYEYCHNMWNMLDFITNSLYIATITLRIIAYWQVEQEGKDPMTAHLGRHIQRREWDAWDPTLISECVFATANIFSSLKLVHIFTVNPHLGPLQISLGRMVIDIIKFFFVYCLVLFAFACGLNQLMWYYATMRAKDCDKGRMLLKFNHTKDETLLESCEAKYSSFANLFNTLETLFWATFGLVDLERFVATPHHWFTEWTGKCIFGSYSIISIAMILTPKYITDSDLTEWAGKTMFGTYGIISIVVLLNMLIAMMSNSYEYISNQSDAEWKFARSKLWIEYFEEGGTVPVPFNIIPSPKSLWHLVFWFLEKFCHWSRRIQQTKQRSLRLQKILRAVSAKEANYQLMARRLTLREANYKFVMRNLVKRYIAHMQRIKQQAEGVSEDDVNEIKQDISAFRFELLEILRNAGYTTGHSNVAQKTNYRSKRKSAQAERRLMKGFQVPNIDPIPEVEQHAGKTSSASDIAETTSLGGPGKFGRLRKLSKKLPIGRKWGELAKHAAINSQLRQQQTSAGRRSPDTLSLAMEMSRLGEDRSRRGSAISVLASAVRKSSVVSLVRQSAVMGSSPTTPLLLVTNLPLTKTASNTSALCAGSYASTSGLDYGRSMEDLENEMEEGNEGPLMLSAPAGGARSCGVDPTATSEVISEPPPYSSPGHSTALQPQPATTSTEGSSVAAATGYQQTYAAARLPLYPASTLSYYSTRPTLLHQRRQLYAAAGSDANRSEKTDDSTVALLGKSESSIDAPPAAKDDFYSSSIWRPFAASDQKLSPTDDNGGFEEAKPGIHLKPLTAALSAAMKSKSQEVDRNGRQQSPKPRKGDITL